MTGECVSGGRPNGMCTCKGIAIVLLIVLALINSLDFTATLDLELTKTVGRIQKGFRQNYNDMSHVCHMESLILGVLYSCYRISSTDTSRNVFLYSV